MTKEQTTQAIKVMKEWLDGKQIESKLKEQPNSEFMVASNINWNFYSFDYRVKPEPTYRPYKDVDEMDAAIVEHGYYVLGNASNNRRIIEGWNNCTVEISRYGVMSYIDFLKNHRWVDGTPCGVKEE